MYVSFWVLIPAVIWSFLLIHYTRRDIKNLEDLRERCRIARNVLGEMEQEIKTLKGDVETLLDYTEQQIYSLQYDACRDDRDLCKDLLTRFKQERGVYEMRHPRT